MKPYTYNIVFFVFLSFFISLGNTEPVRIDPQPRPTEIPDTTVSPNTTTTVSPKTTTTVTPTPTTPNTTTPATTTTHIPTPPPPNTTTTSTTPTPSTTPIPTTTIPTTAKPTSAPPKPEPDHKFDGPSFIGGMILTLGLMAIAFVGWKFYKARTERNYHTL